jgi:hypothetical protein
MRKQLMALSLLGAGCSLLANLDPVSTTPTTLPADAMGSADVGPPDVSEPIDTARADTADAPSTGPSDYDRDVLSELPIMYLPAFSMATLTKDESGKSHTTLIRGTGLATERLPNGDLAPRFNGVDQSIEVEDADDLSIANTGRLTMEAWWKPAVLEFPKTEATGYVHALGKGVVGQQEYVFRMYSLTTSDMPTRPNRLSAYAFNLTGGSGSGSYFQDPVDLNQWVHVVATFNTVDTSATFPTGFVRLYKNGVLRDTTSLGQFSVVPQNGSAPLRIGTRDFVSFFAGALGKVAIYSTELNITSIAAHHARMCQNGCP